MGFWNKKKKWNDLTTSEKLAIKIAAENSEVVCEPTEWIFHLQEADLMFLTFIDGNEWYYKVSPDKYSKNIWYYVFKNKEEYLRVHNIIGKMWQEYEVSMQIVFDELNVPEYVQYTMSSIDRIKLFIGWYGKKHGK